MAEQTIKCPTCGTEIELSEALTGQIEASVKARYDAEAALKEKEIAAKLKMVQEKEKSLEEKREAIGAEVT